MLKRVGANSSEGFLLFLLLSHLPFHHLFRSIRYFYFTVFRYLLLLFVVVVAAAAVVMLLLQQRLMR